MVINALNVNLAVGLWMTCISEPARPPFAPHGLPIVGWCDWHAEIGIVGRPESGKTS